MISLSKEQIRLEALKLALTVMQHSGSNENDARNLVITAQTIETYITGANGDVTPAPNPAPMDPPPERNV